MEKTKQYSLAKFSPEVIKEAQRVFRGFLPEKSERGTWIIEEGSERWTLDTEDEFFVRYRKDISFAALACERGDCQLDVYYHFGIGAPNTKVTVSLPSADQIESVFSSFETNYTASVVPQTTAPHAPQGTSKWPEYSMEKRIPTCFVDREMLRALETYILDRVAHVCGADRDAIALDYGMSVTDSAGVESLGTIDNYKFEYFPNDTRSIDCPRL